jgi:hypothetical protein
VIAPREVAQEAERVERLAYTRTQAAEALGLGRSTFIQRVLPFVETIEMPWGAKLIRVDELERLLDERRREARAVRRPPLRPGRKPALASQTVARIRSEHASGRSLGEIARLLNDDGVPTAQGGRRWWPSTVRAVLVRSSPSESAATDGIRIRSDDIGQAELGSDDASEFALPDSPAVAVGSRPSPGGRAQVPP